MEKVLKTGKTKAIGVSNYSVKFLKELLAEATVTPAANQIENHPYLPQQDIVDFCKEKGIQVTAYSPLGSTGSPLFEEEGVQKVAKKHNVKVGTVLVSYASKIIMLPSDFVSCLTTLSRTWYRRHSQVCNTFSDRGEYADCRARLFRHGSARGHFQEQGCHQTGVSRIWCKSSPSIDIIQELIIAVG